MSESPLPIEVMKGVYLIKVPLPNNPLKALNSYLIQDDIRPLLVDVGFSLPECEQALSDALAHFGLAFDDVDLLFTHSHPDHTGCLERIYSEEMSIFAHMHSFIEVNTRQEMQRRTYLPIVDAIYDDAQSRRQHPNRQSLSSELIPLKEDYPLIYIKEDDVIERGGYRFRVIETPGHDSTHICLYDERRRLFISGDHVLERITPNISSFFLETDELQVFLDSLDKVRDLDVDLVLPGHGEVFTQLARRVDQLKAHHFERLAEMEDLVRAGHRDLIAITSNAHWKYPNWHSWAVEQKFFSLGETLAHLVHAVHMGSLRMTIEGIAVEFDLAD